MTTIPADPPEGPAPTFRAGFRAGYQAIFPLWLAVVPFGVAMAILAHSAGLGILQTQAMSVIVFAGAAQLTMIDLIGDGASILAIVLTVLLLNLRHLLYGLSLDRHLPPRTHPPRSILAYFLTDETYGVTIAAYRNGAGSVAYYVGSGASLWTIWQLSTLAGGLIGERIPDPSRYGLEMVFPLTFLSILLPLIRRRPDLVVVAIAAATALVAVRIVDGGTTVFLATIIAAGIGAAITRGEEP